MGGTVQLDGCLHLYCRECLATYVSVSINEGRTSEGTLRCPVDACPVPIHEAVLRDLASSADWAKHQRLVEKRNVLKDPLLRFCPQPDCDGVAHLAQAPTKDNRYLAAECPDCGHAFCGNCGCVGHRWKPCHVALKEQTGDAAYERWKKGKRGGVKACPGCGFHVEKNGGCSAMRCAHCNVAFCWLCLRRRGCTCHANYLPPYHQHLPAGPDTLFAELLWTLLIAALLGAIGWLLFATYVAGCWGKSVL